MGKSRSSLRTIVRWVFAGLFVVSVTVNAGPVLKNIRKIKELSNAAANEEYPVRFTAQVIHFHPELQRVFVHDGDTALYVQLFRPAGTISGLGVGSEVLVGGQTSIGGFSPIVYADEFAITGFDPLPEPMPLTRSMYEAVDFDVEWVSVEGRLLAVEEGVAQGYLVISMDARGSMMDVYIPHSEDLREQLEMFIFQEVRVAGVLGSTANSHHQMTGRTLFVNSVNDFELTQVSYGELPAYVPIHKLMHYGERHQGLVKTRGTLLYSTKDTLYLRGEKNCLKANTLMGHAFRPGDVIELMGYALSAPISPSFAALSAEKIASDLPPEPIGILLSGGEIDTDWNNALIQLDADLIYLGKTFMVGQAPLDAQQAQEIIQEEGSLWCQVGDRVFEARLPAGTVYPADMMAGSLLRLTGICHVLHSKHPQLDQMAKSLWIELPDVASIEVLRKPPWWTTKRLVWVLAAALFLWLLFVAWVSALQKTVSRQTRTIGKQVERETILNERQRIAQELHDTLEQGLAALSIQLKRIFNKVQNRMPEELPVVKQAVSTLNACRNESRASINDLRTGLLEKMSLSEAISTTLKSEQEKVNIQISVDGNAERWPLFVEHQLLRIITEAARNAVQHASPERVDIRLDYSLGLLVVSVQDDGAGFDPEILDTTERFGVKGMHERARRISGALSIESAAGRGTELKLTVPKKQTEE